MHVAIGYQDDLPRTHTIGLYETVDEAVEAGAEEFGEEAEIRVYDARADGEPIALVERIPASAT